MCERAIPGPDHVRPPERATSSGHFRPPDDDALVELQFHWGSAYHLAVVDGAWTARRKDGQGTTLTDPVPEGLRLLIRADYAAIPVPRNLP